VTDLETRLSELYMVGDSALVHGAAVRHVRCFSQVIELLMLLLQILLWGAYALGGLN
jgi:hypothetical protein